jgi:16S rRNA (adenine1518-N6/adenine1519-N6)-dimethyltransferase
MEVQPKKSLGQNFLHDQHYLELIANSGEIKPGETVLEIGPGEGALTAELLSRGAVVTAIEKDHRLIPVLQEKFKAEISEKKLALIEGDVLKYDISYLFSNTSAEGHLLHYKLIANIPYYITGAVIEKFLSSTIQPAQMVLLVQKEVAERITGHPSTPLRALKESILSLSVKAYGEPKYIKTVPAGAFSPPPTVDSAVLSIMNISRKNFMNDDHEARFFELVHAGFAHKRKLLGRNLETLVGPEYSTILKNIGIPEKARAEEVGLEKWLALSRALGLASK